jgi:hypothetical protein
MGTVNKLELGGKQSEYLLELPNFDSGCLLARVLFG